MMAFLRFSAETGRAFSGDDLAQACPSLKASSVRTYLSEGHLAPLLAEAHPPFRVRGEVADLSDDALHRRISQSKRVQERHGLDPLVRQLLARSQTNAALALELVNRPGLANRLDAFVLLMLTAWEQVLKARMQLHSRGSVYTGESTLSGRKVTVGFARAVDSAFPSKSDPIRRNLEWLKDLRDGCAHLVVPELAGIATRYFQSSLLNYLRFYHEVAGEPALRFEGTGLITLGVAYQSPRIEALRVAHGAVADEVRALLDAMEQAAEAENDPRFAVSIRHELVLEKRAGPGTIKLSAADDASAVAVVKVPRDPNSVCPHTTKQCASLLTVRSGQAWNVDAVAVVAAFLKVKSGNNEYHYAHRHGASTLHSYSDAFVDLVCARLAQTPDLIVQARASARAATRPAPTRRNR